MRNILSRTWDMSDSDESKHKFIKKLPKNWQNGPYIVTFSIDITDIKGNPIFDGDIIELMNGRRFEVVWWNYNARYLGRSLKNSSLYGSLLDLISDNEYKIIGNVFENRNLLR